jgi:hypothetical protein
MRSRGSPSPVGVKFSERGPVEALDSLGGWVPDYLYELGRIDTAKPFADLEKLSRVNERAHAADKDPSFSQRLRQGLPKPAPLPTDSAGSTVL